MQPMTYRMKCFIAPCLLLMLSLSLGGCSSNSASNELVTIAPTDIESKIKGERQMQGSNVTAQVADKTVTLTGTTTSPAQIQIAESIAKTMAPGYTITNQLKAGS